MVQDTSTGTSKVHLSHLRFSTALPVLAGIFVVIAVYDSPQFIWFEPPLWILLAAGGILALLPRRVHPLASLFWLLGAVSLSWTLTPADTFLNSLWELTYLAAFAVGRSMVGFVLLNGAMLLVGLERTLLLDLFGLTQYFSGSAHYLAGAQALLFFPFCLAAAARSRRTSLSIVAAVGASICLLLILNSGARAVYLPAVLIIPVTVLRLLIPLGQRLRVVAVTTLATLILVSAVVLMPGPTVTAPIVYKGLAPLGIVAVPVESRQSNQADSVTQVREEGGGSSRLKMWEQAAWIGLENPWGTGAGSFRNTIHAFQRFPLIGFSSAHNVFLEVFATGGWPRLLILLGLLATSLLAGWWTTRWPVALGAVGLWISMCFDITYQMPAIMLIAFWSLGTINAPVRDNFSVGPKSQRSKPSLVLISLVLGVGILGTAWWYWPCEGATCVTGRHVGYRAEAVSAVRGQPQDAAESTAERIVELYPRSYWAWQLRAEQYTSAEDRLSSARELAQHFPLASPRLYLDWAESAVAAGSPEEAERAIKSGLNVFPSDLDPAGVPLGGRAALYQNWLNEADRLLELTRQNQ